MAYERKHGDMVFFKEDRKDEGGPVATGNIFLDGDQYPLKVFRNEKAEGRQPQYKGEVDKNGTTLDFVMWLDGNLPEDSKKPSFTGKIDYTDGYRYTLGLWERKASKTGNIFWSGSVSFNEEYRSQIPNQTQSQPQEQAQMSSNSSDGEKIGDALPF